MVSSEVSHPGHAWKSQANYNICSSRPCFFKMFFTLTYLFIFFQPANARTHLTLSSSSNLTSILVFFKLLGKKYNLQAKPNRNIPLGMSPQKLDFLLKVGVSVFFFKFSNVGFFSPSNFKRNDHPLHFSRQATSPLFINSEKRMASLRMEGNRAILLVTPPSIRKDGVSHREPME